MLRLGGSQFFYEKTPAFLPGVLALMGLVLTASRLCYLMFKFKMPRGQNKFIFLKQVQIYIRDRFASALTFSVVGSSRVTQVIAP